MTAYVKTLRFNDLDFPQAPLPVFDREGNCVDYTYDGNFRYEQCVLNLPSAGAHTVQAGIQVRPGKDPVIEIAIYDGQYHLVSRIHMPLGEILPLCRPRSGQRLALGLRVPVETVLADRLADLFETGRGDFCRLLATGLRKALSLEPSWHGHPPANA